MPCSMARFSLSSNGGRWPPWTVAALFSLVLALPIAVQWAGGLDKAAKSAAELGSVSSGTLPPCPFASCLLAQPSCGSDQNGQSFRPGLFRRG